MEQVNKKTNELNEKGNVGTDSDEMNYYYKKGDEEVDEDDDDAEADIHQENDNQDSPFFPEYEKLKVNLSDKGESNFIKFYENIEKLIN